MRAPHNFKDRLQKSQPLIIIGMHRSGTSLVVRLLNDLGIHLGAQLSRDAESIFFQKINRKIYQSSGSNWGNVDGLLAAMANQNFIQKELKLVSKSLFPERSFLGLNKGLAQHFSSETWSAMKRGEDVWWGWKDPRTTLTFPIWLGVFPNARVLHVLRNGIDVAISTHRRSLKQQGKFWKRMIRLDFVPQTLDFNHCYALWEKYVSFAIKNKDLIQQGHYMEIHYEDLLTQPIKAVKAITDFLGYPTHEDRIERVCRQIDRGRKDNSYYTQQYQHEIRRIEHYELLDQMGYRYPLRKTAPEARREK